MWHIICNYKIPESADKRISGIFNIRPINYFLFSLSNPADRHSFPERYDILSGKFLENYFFTIKNETWSCPDTVGFAELLWRFMKIFLEGLRKIAGRGKPDTSGNLFDTVIGCEQQVTRRRQPNFVQVSDGRFPVQLCKTV